MAQRLFLITQIGGYNDELLPLAAKGSTVQAKRRANTRTYLKKHPVVSMLLQRQEGKHLE